MSFQTNLFYLLDQNSNKKISQQILPGTVHPSSVSLGSVRQSTDSIQTVQADGESQFIIIVVVLFPVSPMSWSLAEGVFKRCSLLWEVYLLFFMMMLGCPHRTTVENRSLLSLVFCHAPSDSRCSLLLIFHTPLDSIKESIQKTSVDQSCLINCLLLLLETWAKNSRAAYLDFPKTTGDYFSDSPERGVAFLSWYAWAE